MRILFIIFIFIHLINKNAYSQNFFQDFRIKVERINELRLKIESINFKISNPEKNYKITLTIIDSILKIDSTIFYFIFLKGEYLLKLKLYDYALLEFQKCLQLSQYYSEDMLCNCYKNISYIYKFKKNKLLSDEYDKKFEECKSEFDKLKK